MSQHLQLAYDHIRKADSILLVCHPKPDGDAMGSMLAMSHHLVELEKNHRCFSVGPVPERLKFLRGADRVLTDRETFASPYTLLVTFDGGDLRYLGIDEELRACRSDVTIVNIDHHKTNEMFGDYNVVEQGAASTSDVLYRFFDANRVKITKDMATCLLTGILTDTGNFSNRGTTVQSLEAASELLRYGARFRKIMTKLSEGVSVPTLQLWGRALERLKQDPATGFTTTAILWKDFQETGAAEEDGDGISNFLNSLNDTKAVFLFRELEDGMVKGSLRTTHDDVDVSKVAQTFGGGGHAKAAGFTTAGKIIESEHEWRVEPR